MLNLASAHRMSKTESTLFRRKLLLWAFRSPEGNAINEASEQAVNCKSFAGYGTGVSETGYAWRLASAEKVLWFQMGG